MRRFIRIVLYTLSMYVVTHVIAFVMLPIGLALVALGWQEPSRLKRYFTGLLFRIVGKRVAVSGLENVEPGKGYVIVANYPSFYASFALMGVFPEASVMAHAFISRIPVLGRLLKRFGTIFVDPKRPRSSRAEMDSSLRGTDERSRIIVFPEGKRSPDGEVHPLRRGFIYLLRNSTLDLLPVTLNGFYRLKPVGRVYLDLEAEPEVLIHRPIDHGATRELNDGELLKVAVNTIKEAYRP